MSQLTARFLGAYSQLGSANSVLREEANQYLLQVVQSNDAWQIAKALLTPNNAQERFLGAQLLYNKSQASLLVLPLEQLQELVGYIFGELERECDSASPNRQVLYMLEKSGAVCCMCLHKHQPSLLANIVSFMRQSPERMVAGATLLGEIPDEIKKLSNNTRSSELRAEFLTQSEISSILVGTLIELRDVPARAEVALQCIKNWVELGVPFADNPRLVETVMSVYLSNQLCFERCCEILIQDCKNISRRGGTTHKEPLVKPTSNELECFKSLIQLLSTSANQLLSEPNTRCQFAEMLQELMQVYSPTLVTLPTPQYHFMLELMLRILQHDDLDTSHYAVRFWTSFYNQLKKLKKGQVDHRLLFDCYGRVYDIARDKCNLVRRPHDEETESSIETELLEMACSGEKGEMVFKEYRVFFVDLFQTIYKLLLAESGAEQGNQQYFAPVFDLLRTSPTDKTVEFQVELALFLTKAINELCIEEGKKSVAAVLSCLPSLKGQEVHREALKLVVGCCRQIASCPMLLTQISGYILNSLADPVVSNYASYAFISLVECINKHHMEEFAVNLQRIYSSPMLDTLSDEAMNKFVAGHIEFIQAFDNQSLRTKYLFQFLEEVANALGNCLQNSLSLKKLQCCLVRLSVVVETLDQSSSKSTEKVVYPFLYKVLHFIQIAIGFCNSLTFSQNNCLGLIVKITKSTVRILGNASSTPALLNILTASMKLMSSNFTENHHLMSILSYVLEFQSKRTELIDGWLLKHLQEFVGYVLEAIQAIPKPNTDLLKNFFIVLQKVIVYLPEVVASCNHKQALEELSLRAFKLEDVHLAKQLLIFIELYIDSAATPSEIEQFIPRVIAMSFFALPYLNVASFGTLGSLLKVYCKVVFPVNLEHFLTNCEWMKNASAEELKIIARVLQQSIKQHNPKTVKGVLSLLSSIGKGNPRQEIFVSIKRMYDNWYEQQNASD